MPKLLFFVTEDWYFCSHRLPLARAALKAGFEVVILTRIQSHRADIESAGIRVIHIAMQRGSLNPLRELKTLWRVFSVFRGEKPDIVHLVALKPVIYGGLMARLAGVRHVVSAIAGMGYTFTSRQPMARLLRPFLILLFRFLLNRSNVRVIVQNPDDRDLLVTSGGVHQDRIVLIRGAGVDLETFAPTPEETVGPPTVLLVSRMLWSKGVGEFIAAARILRQQGASIRFVLVGEPDLENPASVPELQLKAWQREGLVEWWGHRSNMPEIFLQAHIVCLPTSYGEGVPKVLIEAAACGKPIIASDTPGCREIVRHGDNGLLVPAKNIEALVVAISQLREDPKLRRLMGARGRDIVAQDFSLVKVITETLAVYHDLLAS